MRAEKFIRCLSSQFSLFQRRRLGFFAFFSILMKIKGKQTEIADFYDVKEVDESFTLLSRRRQTS